MRYFIAPSPAVKPYPAGVYRQEDGNDENHDDDDARARARLAVPDAPRVLQATRKSHSRT